MVHEDSPLPAVFVNDKGHWTVLLYFIFPFIGPLRRCTMGISMMEEVMGVLEPWWDVRGCNAVGGRWRRNKPPTFSGKHVSIAAGFCFPSTADMKSPASVSFISVLQLPVLFFLNRFFIFSCLSFYHLIFVSALCFPLLMYLIRQSATAKL